MAKKKEKKIISTYSYLGVDEKEVFQVLRYEDKEFRVRYMGKDGQWVWKAAPFNVPYNLPYVLSSSNQRIIFVVEGEKDADRLMNEGQLATTNRGGAGNTKAWNLFTPYFRDKAVCVIADNDEAGKRHAEGICEILASVTSQVVLLELPGLDEKGDVSDWLDIKGNDLAKLIMLAQDKFAHLDALEAKLLPEPIDEYPPGDAFEPIEDCGDPFEKFEVGWKPFPLDCLPHTIREYCSAMSDAIKVDPAYLAHPALIFAAGLIGNARIMRLNRTWPEASVLFGCLIADSSTRKSPAMRWAAEPINLMNYEHAKEYKSRAEDFKLNDRIWVENNAGVDNEVGDAEASSRPRRPIKKRILISDITIETIVREMENNPRGLILMRDELRAWFSSFGRYKSGTSGGGDMSFWLEVINASTFIYDRKSGDQTSVVVPRCAISVMGTIQPTVISKIFTREYFESGFVSRILLSMPPKRAGKWDRYEVDPDVMQRYEQLYRKLHEFDWVYSQDVENKPREILMDAEADEIWGKWYDPWQEQQRDSEGDVTSLMAKLEGYCSRFAMILSVCEWLMGETETDHVNADQMTRAIKLAEWFKCEGERVYGFCRMNDCEVDETRLLEKIAARGGYITARELFLMNKAKYQDTDQTKEILRGLAERGKLRKVSSVPGRQVRRGCDYFTTVLH